ncbi:MAG: Hsp20/alpha crystallin family protein [Gemmataceae bacterium]
MRTRRWESNLWRQVERFRDEMNNLLEGNPTGTWPILGNSYPPLNAWESEDALFVEAELPGLKLEDLEIYVGDGDQLSIKGVRKPLEMEKAVWHRRERGVGEFSRVLKLPFPVNEDKVEARFEHGVLRITLPKSEKARPRRIEVKAD